MSTPPLSEAWRIAASELNPDTDLTLRHYKAKHNRIQTTVRRDHY